MFIILFFLSLRFGGWGFWEFAPQIKQYFHYIIKCFELREHLNTILNNTLQFSGWLPTSYQIHPPEGTSPMARSYGRIVVPIVGQLYFLRQDDVDRLVLAIL